MSRLFYFHELPELSDSSASELHRMLQQLTDGFFQRYEDQIHRQYRLQCAIDDAEATSVIGRYTEEEDDDFNDEIPF